MDIKKYSVEALKTVTGANFLEVGDWSELKNMQNELQANYEKQQMWRTETEMRVSVLNDIKHPTNASKYWQCVREQAVFFEQLVLLSFDYRRNDLAIKKLDSKIKSTTGFAQEEAQIDLEECLYKQKNMQLAAKNRLRELKLWAQLKGELDDGTFDTQDVNKHQLKSYGIAFKQELKIAMDSGNASPSEAANIVGRAQTVERLCSNIYIEGDL